VPASLKLQEEFGDDLQVLFVESQRASAEQMEGFVLHHKWLGTRAMWTVEPPLRSGSKGLPSYVLLDASGSVVGRGSHATSRTADQIADLIKAAKAPPEGTPRALKSAWKSYAKGDLGKALAAASRERGKEQHAAQAEEAITAIEGAIERRLGALEWCLDSGHLVEAGERLEELKKVLKGAGEHETRLAELRTRLESPEMKPERDACKALERILVKVYSDGPGKSGKHLKALRKLAERHPGTRAAERARHLAGL